MLLPASFFKKDTLTAAKELLGTFLVHESDEGITIGRIVETECYLGSKDPASHSYKGENIRNAAMFKAQGHVYIYLIYGMYYCLNIVFGKKGVGEAVLIRALEPVEGIDLMKKRRKSETIYNLCSGPAKLMQAMGILSNLNGTQINKGSLKILTPDSFPQFIKKEKIISSGRVGISQGQDLKYRFFYKDNPFVSR